MARRALLQASSLALTALLSSGLLALGLEHSFGGPLPCYRLIAAPQHVHEGWWSTVRFHGAQEHLALTDNTLVPALRDAQEQTEAVIAFWCSEGPPRGATLRGLVARGEILLPEYPAYKEAARRRSIVNLVGSNVIAVLFLIFVWQMACARKAYLRLRIERISEKER